MSEKYPGVFDEFSSVIEYLVDEADVNKRRDRLFGDESYRELYESCLDYYKRLTNEERLLELSSSPRIGSHPMVVWPNHQIYSDTKAFFQFARTESYPDVIETSKISDEYIEIMHDGYYVVSKDFYWERHSSTPSDIVIGKLSEQEFGIKKQDEVPAELKIKRVSWRDCTSQKRSLAPTDYPLSQCILYIARPIDVKQTVPSPLHFDLRNFPQECADMHKLLSTVRESRRSL